MPLVAAARQINKALGCGTYTYIARRRPGNRVSAVHVHDKRSTIYSYVLRLK